MDFTESQYSALQWALNFLKICGEYEMIQLLSTKIFLFLTFKVIFLSLSSVKRREYRGSHHYLLSSQLSKNKDNVWRICFRLCTVIPGYDYHKFHVLRHYFIRLGICFGIRNFYVNDGVNFIRSNFLDHSHFTSSKSWYYTMKHRWINLLLDSTWLMRTLNYLFGEKIVNNFAEM